ncbi:MAG: serine/threonine protein kinase, partial [Actinomycetota bacterium]|nr:serine/threonine protein kinase [Actinomycetota bacterium]
TAEVLLARARAALDNNEPARARGYAADLLADDPWEWRALWMDGLASTAQEDWSTAMASFNAVCQQVPGELAPKLALAVACERGGRPEVAEGLYDTCAQTDATYVAPASFGMARVRAMRGDAQGAVAALDQVPSSSRGFVESRQVRADVLLTAGNANDLAVLDEAMRSIESVSMDPTTKRRYTVRILQQALAVVLAGGAASKAKVGSLEATEAGLRQGLESTFRNLARDASQLDERIELVNQANAVRSWTLT